MGYSSWSSAAYGDVRRARTSRPAGEIFRETGTVDPLMDPRHLVVREARDSEHHPRSVPIIVGFDVTASMGHIPTDFAKVQLGRLMTLLVEQGWVRDPQVLFAAHGDAVSDRGPLQVGQFESGLEMDMWLTRIWLEGRGGDVPESTTLVHWFAAHRTATDAWEKRGERGFLFTIGDAPNKELRPSHLSRVFGGSPTEACSDAEVLAAARERWDCWHIVVPSGARVYPHSVTSWRRLLGEQAIVCTRHQAICELMGAIMGVRQARLDLEAARDVLVGAQVASTEIDDVLAALA
ncbi:MAG: hypothetical protein H6736_24950 [Alphaproteobacteria bacterium]|nr:hypothetical protein [Alphaproteobacteria bacterium]MCB9695066.1 hypothetical protein [Alphaproteobacteria bacterium]